MVFHCCLPSEVFLFISIAFSKCTLLKYLHFISIFGLFNSFLDFFPRLKGRCVKWFHNWLTNPMVGSFIHFSRYFCEDVHKGFFFDTLNFRFFKQRLSVQQYFNLLEGKLNDLKTDSKASIIERLEIITKIKDVTTNAHPDAMRHLIKDSIDL